MYTYWHTNLNISWILFYAAVVGTVMERLSTQGREGLVGSMKCEEGGESADLVMRVVALLCNVRL